MAPGRLSVLALATFVLFAAGCPNGAGITCPTGLTLCGDKCIFVSSDPGNCGGCGMVCPGSLACISGACGCPAPLSNCGDVCVDENVDGHNCGACTNSCGPGRVCSQASCELTCAPNLLQCAQSCVDGNVDPANCGTCGHACGQFEICCAGACLSAGTMDHCGSCAPCPNAGDFCSFDFMMMTFTCNAG